MGLKKRVLGFAIFCVCVISGFLSAADDSKITTYGDACSKELPAGWQHLANTKGEIGDFGNYTPLSFKLISEKYWWRNYYENADLKIRSGARDNFVPGNKDGAPKIYAINAYTFQDGIEGDVWLSNVNIQCRGKSPVDVRFYLNGKLLKKDELKHSRTPSYFNFKVGKVKKGDVLYFAGASANSKNACYRLYYTIEKFPEGTAPPAAVNIISPEITEMSPVLEADGRPKKSFMDAHKKHCAEGLKNKPRLILLGDSITARWSDEFLKGKGALAKYNPANFGVGGDWVQNVLWRVENGVFDKIKPEVVVLLIGTNNITHKFTAEEVASGYKAIIDLIHKKSPDTKVVMMGIFPRGRSIHNNPRYEIVKKTNVLVSAMADSEKLFYLDIGEKLVEPDGTITKQMMKDGLHIGRDGFVIWADALVPLLDKIMRTDK